MKKQNGGSKGSSPKRVEILTEPPSQNNLISPWVSKLLAEFKAGKIPKNDTIEYNPQTIPKELSPFLESDGDLNILSEILAKHPSLIKHPIVFDQLYYLRDVRREMVLQNNYYGQNYKDAFEQTKLIMQALISGFMPEWTLKPPPGKPGRKIDEDEHEKRSRLIDDYENLLISFKEHETFPKDGESDQEWRKRWLKILKRVWKESDIPEDVRYWRDKETSRILYKTKRVPLPSQEIMNWLEGAEELQGRAKSIRDFLAYSLLGYRWKLTPSQVKHKIQEERKLQK